MAMKGLKRKSTDDDKHIAQIAKKRKRKEPLSSEEIKLLLNLYEESLEVFRNKEKSTESRRAQRQTWDKIVQTINAKNSQNVRTRDELRKIYQNLEDKAKKLHERQKRKAELSNEGEEVNELPEWASFIISRILSPRSHEEMTIGLESEISEPSTSGKASGKAAVDKQEEEQANVDVDIGAEVTDDDETNGKAPEIEATEKQEEEEASGDVVIDHDFTDSIDSAQVTDDDETNDRRIDNEAVKQQINVTLPDKFEQTSSEKSTFREADTHYVHSNLSRQLTRRHYTDRTNRTNPSFSAENRRIENSFRSWRTTDPIPLKEADSFSYLYDELERQKYEHEQRLGPRPNRNRANLFQMESQNPTNLSQNRKQNGYFHYINKHFWLYFFSFLTVCIIIPFILFILTHEMDKVFTDRPEVFTKETTTRTEEFPSPRTMEDFLAKIDSLLQRSSNQSVQTKIVLRTAGKMAFDTKNPKKPTVLLLVGEPSTTKCFAKDLATVAEYMYGIENVHSGETSILVQESDSNMAKRALRNALDDRLTRFKTAAVLSIDELQGEAPLVLHDYCDHDDAPFKKAFIILTMNAEIDQEKCNEAAIHDILRQRWTVDNKLDDYKVEPVLSRMGSLVICLHSQSNVDC